MTAGASVAASIGARGRTSRLRRWAGWPMRDGSSQARPCGQAAAFQVGEGGLVGRDHAGPGAGFDAHVADRHAAFHRKRTNGGAGIFDHVAGGAGGADAADDVEDDVLGRDAEGQLAFDIDAEGFRLVLRQRLRGHHVLDFAGADAEGECAECAMGGVCESPQTIVMPAWSCPVRGRSCARCPVQRPERRRTRCRIPRSCDAAPSPARLRLVGDHKSAVRSSGGTL